MSEVADYFYELTIPFVGEQTKGKVMEVIEAIQYDGANEGEYRPEIGDKAAFQIIDSIENFKLIDEKLESTIEMLAIFFFEDDFESKKDDALKILDKNKISYRLLKKPVEDWNQEWKKHYRPIELNNNFHIIPSHLMGQEKKESEIYIIPGQGFGTGEHSTTFLCLNLFLDILNDLKGKDCLDFGCGSGILGIGVIKWAQMHCDFMDLDPRALDNCVENLVLNFEDQNLGDTRVVSRDRFQIEKQYDLVFANILEHVLISERENIDECVKPGGELILSGILVEQIENIKNKYNEIGYTLESEATKDEWAALRMKKA